MTEKDPREGNLPKWAQQLLSNERYRADRAERRLAEHLETVEPSPIWYGDWQNKIYIPDPYGYQRVNFDVTGKMTGHTYNEISIGMRKGALHVMAGQGVFVKPLASNCFDVLLRD